MSSTPFDSTLRFLASRWRGAGLLIPAFALLARGQPLTLAEIAQASAATDEDASHALAAARAERDSNGRFVDLYGLTLSPTLHRLDIRGKVLFGCCALWAHVVPRILNAPIRVESVDPIRREIVRLSITPDGVEDVHPVGSAATLAVATREAIEADVCQAFCCQVRHFASRDSALEFAAAQPARHVVALPELEQAAVAFHRAIRVAARG